MADLEVIDGHKKIDLLIKLAEKRIDKEKFSNRTGLVCLGDFVFWQLKDEIKEWRGASDPAKSFQSKISTARNAAQLGAPVPLPESRIKQLAQAFSFTDNLESFLKDTANEFETVLRRNNANRILTLPPLTPEEPTRRRGASIFMEPLGQGYEMTGAVTVETRARRYNQYVYGYNEIAVEFLFEKGKAILLRIPAETKRGQWDEIGAGPLKLRIGGTPQEPRLELRAHGERAIILGTVLDNREVGEFQGAQLGDIIRVRVMAHQQDAEIGEALVDKDLGPVCGNTPQEKDRAELVAAMLASEDRKGAAAEGLEDGESGYITLAEAMVKVVEQTNA